MNCQLLKIDNYLRSSCCILTISLFFFFSSGCASSVIKGSPPLPTYQATTVETLAAKYSQPNAIPFDPTLLTKEQRNQIVEDIIYLIDVNYTKFEGELSLSRASFETSSDLAVLGLGAAGSLINVTSTQALLAAISGGISGARVSINKNFFYEQSTSGLVSTMRASRKKKLEDIRKAEALLLADYPMSQALGDTTDYYNAGTIVGALQSIISEAGKKEKDADKAIEDNVQKKIDLQYKSSTTRKSITNWLLADPSKNVPAFNDWLTKKQPPVTISPIFWVQSTDTSETDLMDAAAHFGISIKETIK
jgi:hypothetical protein